MTNIFIDENYIYLWKTCPGHISKISKLPKISKFNYILYKEKTYYRIFNLIFFIVIYFHAN